MYLKHNKMLIVDTVILQARQLAHLQAHSVAYFVACSLENIIFNKHIMVTDILSHETSHCGQATARGTAGRLIDNLPELSNYNNRCACATKQRYKRLTSKHTHTHTIVTLKVAA